MNVLKILFISIIYLMEPYFWIKSMSVMKHKFADKKYYVFAFFGYYSLTLVKQMIAFSGKNEGLASILGLILIIYLFVIPLLIYCEPVHKLFINNGIFTFCVFITESLPIMGFMFLFKLSLYDVQKFGWLNSFCTLGAKSFLGITCYFFFFQGAKRLVSRLYGNKEIIFLVIVSLLMEVPLLAIINNMVYKENKQLYLLALFIQFVLIGNMFYIILILRKQRNKMTDMEEELNKSKQIIELSSKLSDLRHDISFHVNIMKSLAESEDYKELVKYMNNAFTDVETAKNFFTLPDKSLSAILNVLATKAQEKAIDFRHIIMVENYIIPSHEICSLVSNIVTNAIEAVEKLPKEKRVICLEIVPDVGGYYISCVNPYFHKPKMENGSVVTSKVDSINHGRGIRIIKKIAERNHGIVKVVVHDTCFEMYCFIPDK